MAGEAIIASEIQVIINRLKNTPHTLQQIVEYLFVNNFEVA